MYYLIFDPRTCQGTGSGSHDDHGPALILAENQVACTAEQADDPVSWLVRDGQVVPAPDAMIEAARRPRHQSEARRRLEATDREAILSIEMTGGVSDALKSYRAALRKTVLTGILPEAGWPDAPAA